MVLFYQGGPIFIMLALFLSECAYFYQDVSIIIRVRLFLLMVYFDESGPIFIRVGLFLSEFAYFYQGGPIFYQNGPIFIRMGLFLSGWVYFIRAGLRNKVQYCSFIKFKIKAVAGKKFLKYTPMEVSKKNLNGL